MMIKLMATTRSTPPTTMTGYITAFSIIPRISFAR